MLRTFVFAILLVSLVPIVAAQAPGQEFLPAGTILHCTLDEPNFSSRTAEVGDPILCHTGALPAVGHTVFSRSADLADYFQEYRDRGHFFGKGWMELAFGLVPSHGADLAGYFQEYRDPGHFFGKGWMELTFDRLVLPGGVTVPVSARVIAVRHLRVDREGKIHGGGHPKRDAVEWAIPVLWPEKVVTLPARGPRPTLKGEVRVTLRLLEDVEVPPTGVASRTLPR